MTTLLLYAAACFVALPVVIWVLSRAGIDEDPIDGWSTPPQRRASDRARRRAHARYAASVRQERLEVTRAEIDALERIWSMPEARGRS